MKRVRAFAGIALTCLTALCFGAVARSARSEEKPYPSRQINYMVCFDPGGQSDREARRQQPLLEKVLGQKVNIDYKIGGGGALGWKELTKAKPDGYTIAGFNVPHVILQPLLISQGSWLIFFNRPIAGFFMVLALASIARGIWLQVRFHAPEVAIDDADE